MKYIAITKPNGERIVLHKNKNSEHIKDVDFEVDADNVYKAAKKATQESEFRYEPCNDALDGKVVFSDNEK